MKKCTRAAAVFLIISTLFCLLTYEAFIPLIAVALIYLVIVILLSAGVSKLERRLKKNER